MFIFLQCFDVGLYISFMLKEIVALKDNLVAYCIILVLQEKTPKYTKYWVKTPNETEVGLQAILERSFIVIGFTETNRIGLFSFFTHRRSILQDRKSVV